MLRILIAGVKNGAVPDLTAIDFPTWANALFTDIHNFDAAACILVFWLAGQLGNYRNSPDPIPQSFTDTMLQLVVSGGAGLFLDMMMYCGQQLQFNWYKCVQSLVPTIGNPGKARNA